MRYIWLLSLLALTACQSPSEKSNGVLSYTASIEQHRRDTDSLFTLPESSPLPGIEAIAAFEGLLYFPIDSTYRVQANWKRTRNQEPFIMPTTGDHDNRYVLFGKAYFTLNDLSDTLHIYQNLELAAEGRLEESLFIPFRDATTGQTTYGGGRYLNLSIPEENKITLDFNLAYNPYCVYNYKYSCPIPPVENTLSMAVEAGEKMIEIRQP